MNHETNLVRCGIATDATRNDGDEEIYGGEISVLDRSWAKEINHMLCSCMSTCACVCEKDLFQDIYQRIQKPLLESNTKCIRIKWKLLKLHLGK